MNSTRLAVLACILLSSAACEEPDPPLARNGLRAEAVACWALFVDNDHARAQARLYPLPSFVTLDTTPATRPYALERRLRVLYPFDSLGASLDSIRLMRSSGWAADSLTDSLRVRMHDGFGGAELIVNFPAAAGPVDTLRGRYFDMGDVRPRRTKRGPALLVRASCGRRGAT